MTELKEEHFELHDRNKANRHKQLRLGLITLNKIKEICQNHLCNIEISKIQSCEDTNDLYLLGKWDLAQEIMEEIITKEINE